MRGQNGAKSGAPMTNDREWLETDGLGGFSSGTVSGRRARRYHALLLSAARPPSERFVLVNGLEVQAATPAGAVALSSQRYLPNVVHPDGDRRLESFQDDPWPTWTYEIADGIRIRQEIFVPHGHSAVVVRWTLLSTRSGLVTLTVRPLLSGRDYHALHHENEQFRFDHGGEARRLEWHPYPGVPGIVAMSNGSYSYEPLWYHNFLYLREQERGLDCHEDLASPGQFRFDLRWAPAVCVFTATGPHMLHPRPGEAPEQLAERLAQSEQVRRAHFETRLHRSADQFLVRRGTGQSIIAGYPWFTDWGRDTAIALRGLCLATGRLDTAGQVLRVWGDALSEGMIPNHFPDRGERPVFNSVDASLWYIIAVDEYLRARKAAGQGASPAERLHLQNVIESILDAYSRGTRFGIAADDDGLLLSGASGVQLTWMDAKVGEEVITARSGKPVEVQALWVNALKIGGHFSSRWQDLMKRARISFRSRFWNAEAGCLYDVIDVGGQPGQLDDRIRPNQILAVGGLPLSLLDPAPARSVVDVVEKRLWTPLGLRTLDPGDSDYRPHYVGSLLDRDAAYHQGTAWLWLIGPFVEAWLRVHGNEDSKRKEARAKFVQPLLDHLGDAGLGHLSEIADGEPTRSSAGARQLPRGCPFQAWSLSELLRLEYRVLAPERPDDDGGEDSDER